MEPLDLIQWIPTGMDQDYSSLHALACEVNARTQEYEDVGLVRTQLKHNRELNKTNAQGCESRSFPEGSS